MSKQDKNIRFQLARRKPNVVTCPVCGRKGKFSLYIDIETNEPIDPDHMSGLCNVCGYHYPPKQYFADHGRKADTITTYIAPSATTGRQWIESYDTISPKKVQQSHRHQGTLYDFLCRTFSKNKNAVDEAWDRYEMGVTKDGGTIYWQQDNMGEYRTGEIIKYRSDGHRDPTTAERWAHNAFANYELRQCLFGLHLIKGDDHAPVVLVESPKNALIFSICFPQYISMAVGSKDQLGAEKLWPIRHHKIIALPDIDAIGQWTQKAQSLSRQGYDITAYDIRRLYKCTDEEYKELGAKGDIADLLIMRHAPKYEIPELPLLQALIQKNPSIGTLCRKFHLVPVHAERYTAGASAV